MTIYNGKIKTRYGEYTRSTKYKALILLSPNVSVSKQFTDTYSAEGYIFMDCYSNLEDIHDALNINWGNGYVNVVLIGDAENDSKDDSEFKKWYDKYFRYASGLYSSKGLLDYSRWKAVESLLEDIGDNPYFRGEIYGWFTHALINDEKQ